MERPRGEYAKSAESRRRILEAAAEVFSVSGFRSGSLRDVASGAGMSQAGLLHHFPSKAHLLKALLEWTDQKADAAISPALTGTAFLNAYTEQASLSQEEPAMVELHVTLAAEATSVDHPAHKYFMRRYEVLLARTVEAFADAVRTQEAHPWVDPQGAAESLVALIDGLQVQWLLNRDTDMGLRLRQYLQAHLAVPVTA